MFRHPDMHLRVFPGTKLCDRLSREGRLAFPGGKEYLEPSYAWRDSQVGMFCRMLEDSWSSIYKSVGGLFRDRSFGETDWASLRKLEGIFGRFFGDNLKAGLAGLWSPNVFNIALYDLHEQVRDYWGC